MFIEKLDQASQKNLVDLIARIQGNECCVFIGAGLSVRANYPTWPELLNKLNLVAEQKTGVKINDDNLDMYEKSEEYRRLLGKENFRSFMNLEFNPDNDKQPWLAVHLYLVKMPFVSFITTNYDCLIENAFMENGWDPVYSYYPTLAISRVRDRHIYHIHGIIDHTNLPKTQDSIILTKSDFDEAYAQGSNLIDLLKCVYNELTLFFVGFNVRDIFMMRILENCLANFDHTRVVAFDRGEGELKKIKHFALLPFPVNEYMDEFGRKIKPDEIDLQKSQDQDKELQSLGVFTIRYIPDEHNHTPLIRIIQEMNSIVNGLPAHQVSQDITFREPNQ